jgi:hypothetical protein
MNRYHGFAQVEYDYVRERVYAPFEWAAFEKPSPQARAGSASLVACAARPIIRPHGSSHRYTTPGAPLDCDIAVRQCLPARGWPSPSTMIERAGGHLLMDIQRGAPP